MIPTWFLEMVDDTVFAYLEGKFRWDTVAPPFVPKAVVYVVESATGLNSGH